MWILIQRCLESSVKVDNKIVGSIEGGLVLFVCFKKDDNDKDIDYMINKIINLRIFEDETGIMNKSILEVQKEILSISQFTLYAETRKGNRPSYINSLNGSEAIKLYNLFNEKLSEYLNVETGMFGTDMKVNLVNDGPVSIILESR